jgi:hypothetical protein
MSKGLSLSLYDPPLLVEEKEKQDMKFLRMQQLGNKKEYIIRFEVRRVRREGGREGRGVGDGRVG